MLASCDHASSVEDAQLQLSDAAHSDNVPSEFLPRTIWPSVVFAVELCASSPVVSKSSTLRILPLKTLPSRERTGTDAAIQESSRSPCCKTTVLQDCPSPPELHPSKCSSSLDTSPAASSSTRMVA
ncbi:hypothetical protein PDE_04155 [Penicillium oxalicum 114-2]|uniref:Uncharacterized protein n=1 Tax=Penicillium oxalicum (strain 114-2 / CGMCC 5302) TaxID=933388 RepID=S7ZKJ3_PENO1|nr:hypothetical protein PDE_04155 [Penicillium oxalicum 114-2]